MTQKIFQSLLMSLFILFNCPQKSFSDTNVQTKEFYSKIHTIDRQLKSMEGPEDNVRLKLTDSSEPQLLWIVGTKSEVFKNGATANYPEHFCHSHFRSTPQNFRLNKPNINKYSNYNFDDHIGLNLFSIVQGNLEINLPEGFGVPILSSEKIDYNSMVINPYSLKEPIGLQTKATVKFIRDSDLKEPLKAFFHRAIVLQVPIDPKSIKKECDCFKSLKVDMGNSNEIQKPSEASMKYITKSDDGTVRSYHWMVPPGRHEYRNPVSPDFLPYDTTAHLIVPHLHSYGKSIELRDLTDNKTIFKSVVKHFKDRPAIEHIGLFNSRDGVTLYKDHKYEIVSVYNNTTKNDIDAMAVLWVYLHNKDFSKINVVK